MSRRLYIQDSGTTNLTGSVGTTSTSTSTSNTQVNTNNDQVAITVTLNQNTSSDTINTKKIIAETGIITYLTAINNLILINEIPETLGYQDNSIYLKEQIGFYFKYQKSQESGRSYAFMGFINNTINNYHEFAFFKENNIETMPADTTSFMTNIDNIYLADYLSDIKCLKVNANSLNLFYQTKTQNNIIQTYSYLTTPNITTTNTVSNDYNIIIGTDGIKNIKFDIRNGNASFGSDVNISGNTVVRGNLTVVGQLLFQESVIVSTDIYKEINIINNNTSYYSVDISGNISSLGNQTLDGNLNVNSDTSLNRNLYVKEITNLNGQLITDR
jgi:hypothetical protein